MGWLRKTVKKIGKGIKKIGKKIGKAFKSILKPFAKVFNKLGPLGSIAMMMILPGIGQMLAGFGSGWVATNIGAFAGKAVSFVGNAINFVATAPQKIFQTITGGITNGWNGLFTDPIKGGAKGGTWWNNFKTEMGNTWTSSGITDVATGATDVGKGNWFDYSEQGATRLKNFGKDFSKMGTDIKGLFKGDSKTPITSAEADNMLDYTDPSIMERDFRIVPDGAIAKLRQGAGTFTKKLSDITVPGVGDVGDLAWGGSAAITAYNAYSQFNPDDPQGSGGSGLNALAEEQLYGGDQGGLYDMTKVKAWAYNPNIGATENSINYQNLYNQALGFPPDFNPMYSPYYGETYNQSFSRQLEA